MTDNSSFDINSVWDTFFYYGGEKSKSDISVLDTECRTDLYELLLQNKRSLFYYRSGSAGVSEYENNPNGIGLQIFARFDIAEAVSYRNQLVSNGEGDSVDRRIAVSQNSVGFEQPQSDELNVLVLYFLYAKYDEPKSDSFSMVR